MTEFVGEHWLVVVTAIVVGFIAVCYIFTIAVNSDIQEIGLQISKRIKFWMKK